MHSVTDRRTDRQTDGQQAYANSRSYCVAVRSAKNTPHLGRWRSSLTLSEKDSCLTAHSGGLMIGCCHTEQMVSCFTH